MCGRRTHKATSPTCPFRGSVWATLAGASLLPPSIQFVIPELSYELGSDSQRAVTCVTKSEEEERTLPVLGLLVIKLETMQFIRPDWEKANKGGIQNKLYSRANTETVEEYCI
jgi:hypothetical protein